MVIPSSISVFMSDEREGELSNSGAFPVVVIGSSLIAVVVVTASLVDDEDAGALLVVVSNISVSISTGSSVFSVS